MSEVLRKSCGCFDRVLDKVKNQVLEQLPVQNAINDTLAVSWGNRVFRLDGSANQVMIPINVEYRRRKVNGEPFSKLTKNDTNMMMTYCPFCGVKFD